MKAAGWGELFRKFSTSLMIKNYSDMERSYVMIMKAIYDRPVHDIIRGAGNHTNPFTTS